MKIIITGATGSLGAVLTRHYANKGHTIIATGKVARPHANLQKYADYIQADILHAHDLPEADLIIHTAALSDDKASKADLYRSNVTGTTNTLKAARKCPDFIHISSSSVYLPSPLPLTEDLAGKQKNRKLSPYGYSKLYAEYAIGDHCVNNSCFVLRPRAHYGAYDKLILPRILKLVKNGTIQKPGSLEVKISLTNYENVIHAIDCCIKSNRTGINTYNISDDCTYIFIEVIRKICRKLYGEVLPEKHIPIFLLKLFAIFKIGGITPLLVRSLTNDMVLDITKAKKELNYNPKLKLDNSLNEITDWVKRIGGPEVLKNAEKHLAWD